MDGVLEVVRECRGEPAAAIVARLREAAGRFIGEGGEQKDDLTILVCKAL
jgi:serine phosphatase RsbU (regulator of sigma subunit)